MKTSESLASATPKEIRALAYSLIVDARICARCLGAWVHETEKHRFVLCKSCLNYWRDYRQDHKPTNTQSRRTASTYS